jgi:hypothetical protein
MQQGHIFCLDRRSAHPGYHSTNHFSNLNKHHRIASGREADQRFGNLAHFCQRSNFSTTSYFVAALLWEQ